MTRRLMAALLCATTLPTIALAQASVQWSSADAPPSAARESVPGHKKYFEPEKIKKNGEIVSFSLYRSQTPGANDALGEYMINCASREFVTVTKGQASEPMKILAGEEFYAVGKRFCEWDQKGFFSSFF